ncbi:MAG TPA: M48 family metalloprotease [Luteimonas sp.]|nr:M48 family metalloprotease [Luteimonas sp.]
MRLLPPVAALTLALAGLLLPSLPAPAQESGLPDIGSSAGEVLAPAQQKQYGEMTLSQLRNYGYTLDDPLLGGWLQSIGDRLGAASDRPQQDFTLFLLRQRQINAFATLGGYVAVNAGLVLAADSEDEMAAVISHEIAHVTQSHVLRAVERAQRDSIPILLAMIGAIAIAQSAGGNSGDNAAMAAMASAQGLLAQRQIDYTRANESEADRIGIRTLARSGYDPKAMAAFFVKLQAVIRSNQGGERERTPDYLQSHPVTTTRISEARQRAEQLATTEKGFTPSGGASNNPLLPGSLQISSTAGNGDSGQFLWARERLRVLSADTPNAAVREYERLRKAGDASKFGDAQRYGLALARLLDGHAAAAAAELAPLSQEYPGNLWISLALGESEARSSKTAAADARFEALLARMPGNRAVALTYAGMLAERNTPAAGKRAQAVLRPLLGDAGDDPVFQSVFARTSEIAGDPVRAGEAWAEAAYLNGRPEQALVQLNTLKKRDDVDYYARARIDARIAAITPTVLELRREGIRDEDLHRH